jgi:hypothetical protein
MATKSTQSAKGKADWEQPWRLIQGRSSGRFLSGLVLCVLRGSAFNPMPSGIIQPKALETRRTQSSRRKHISVFVTFALLVANPSAGLSSGGFFL